ncbi:DUF952 domain-containing protein [Brevundimonas poindexterae]|uniref:DUF952 domain-containing protein n=1 Tax=Brevundimonas poindexterae TaxID=74325 RepID=UPI001CFEBE61|nr:DUF952 domain-containing protein [Brevundimonas poindexterae]
MSGTIFKLVDAEEWEAATADGHYPGSEVDRLDGYIHMSTAEQLPGTASKHYAGRTNLVLVTLETAALDDLVWEPSRGGALFPHLYRPLPLGAVRAVEACHVDAAGTLHIDAGEPA